jgi:hypothetical protein
VLIHELGHALVNKLGCKDVHLCEVTSQLLERMIAPFHSFPNDLPELTLNVHRVAVDGSFDRGRFTHSLDRWLVERDRYIWFDYTFGWLLGDVLAMRVQRDGMPDFPAIAALIEKAHTKKTPGEIVRALGFANKTAFADAMQRAYVQLQLNINDPRPENFARDAYRVKLRKMFALLKKQHPEIPESEFVPNILLPLSGYKPISLPLIPRTYTPHLPAYTPSGVQSPFLPRSALQLPEPRLGLTPSYPLITPAWPESIVIPGLPARPAGTSVRSTLTPPNFQLLQPRR